MAAKFEISKDKSGKFRFHLKAANGEIIAASQGSGKSTTFAAGALVLTGSMPLWALSLVS